MQDYFAYGIILLDIAILFFQLVIKVEIKRLDDKLCDILKRVYRLEDKVLNGK